MLGKQCHRVTTFCINTCFQSFSTPLKRKSRVSVPGYTLAPSKRWSLVASAAPTPPLRRSLRIYTGRRSRSQLRRRRLGRPGGGVRYSCCMIIASGIRLCARPPCRYFPSPGDAAPAGQQQQQQQQPPLIRHGTASHRGGPAPAISSPATTGSAPCKSAANHPLPSGLRLASVQTTAEEPLRIIIFPRYVVLTRYLLWSCVHPSRPICHKSEFYRN